MSAKVTNEAALRESVELALINAAVDYGHDKFIMVDSKNAARATHKVYAPVLAAKDAEIERLTGALTNARAVASDRIADRDKMLRDIMRERDEARAELRVIVEKLGVEGGA